MIYPEAIEVNGKAYRIRTGYEYAIACFACINDPELSDTERAFGVVGILFDEMPPDEDMPEALRLSVKYLQCGEEAKSGYRRPDMDFEADDNRIRASFLSDYRIDLDTVGLHWYKFSALLQGLSDDCILNRVRDLRNYDLSTVKDAKLRQRILQAQQDVTLPERLSDEEQDIVDDFYSQLKD